MGDADRMRCVGLGFAVVARAELCDREDEWLRVGSGCAPDEVQELQASTIVAAALTIGILRITSS